MTGEHNHRKHSPDKDALCVFCWIEDRALLQRENERLTAELAKFYECDVQDHAHGSAGRPGGVHTNNFVWRHVYHKEGE